jgi:hypothetical protein
MERFEQTEQATEKQKQNDAAPLPKEVENLVQEADNLKQASELLWRIDSNKDDNLTLNELKEFKPQDVEDKSAKDYMIKNFKDLAKGDGSNASISMEDINKHQEKVTTEALLSLANVSGGASELNNKELYSLGACIPRDEGDAQNYTDALNRELIQKGFSLRDVSFELKPNVENIAQIGGSVDHVLYLKHGDQETAVARKRMTTMRC